MSRRLLLSSQSTLSAFRLKTAFWNMMLKEQSYPWTCSQTHKTTNWIAVQYLISSIKFISDIWTVHVSIVTFQPGQMNYCNKSYEISRIHYKINSNVSYINDIITFHHNKESYETILGKVMNWNDSSLTVNGSKCSLDFIPIEWVHIFRLLLE